MKETENWFRFYSYPSAGGPMLGLRYYLNPVVLSKSAYTRTTAENVADHRANSAHLGSNNTLCIQDAVLYEGTLQ